MGVHRERSERNERAQRRDNIIEKMWPKQMKMLMNRSDSSLKEIDFKSSHRREIEELWKLQR
jgi:hypothetical protein